MCRKDALFLKLIPILQGRGLDFARSRCRKNGTLLPCFAWKDCNIGLNRVLKGALVR